MCRLGYFSYRTKIFLDVLQDFVRFGMFWNVLGRFGMLLGHFKTFWNGIGTFVDL